jgi:hypothetical protein
MEVAEEGGGEKEEHKAVGGKNHKPERARTGTKYKMIVRCRAV